MSPWHRRQQRQILNSQYLDGDANTTGTGRGGPGGLSIYIDIDVRRYWHSGTGVQFRTSTISPMKTGLRSDSVEVSSCVPGTKSRSKHAWISAERVRLRKGCTGQDLARGTVKCRTEDDQWICTMSLQSQRRR